jgi:hypothetical protein
MAPDYDYLTLMQKVEVFEYALENTTGQDLYRVLWLKSRNSESWVDRRTTYIRSLASTSMIGYILGLGDRHPSNLLLERVTGKIVHIDFVRRPLPARPLDPADIFLHPSGRLLRDHDAPRQVPRKDPLPPDAHADERDGSTSSRLTLLRQHTDADSLELSTSRSAVSTAATAEVARSSCASRVRTRSRSWPSSRPLSTTPSSHGSLSQPRRPMRLRQKVRSARR